MATNSVNNKVVVSIYGEDYPITGVSDPGYISRIADIVDSRMKDVANGSRVKSRDKVAILAAMSIASELYEKTDDLTGSRGEMNKTVDRIIEQMDKALGSL